MRKPRLPYKSSIFTGLLTLLIEWGEPLLLRNLMIKFTNSSAIEGNRECLLSYLVVLKNLNSRGRDKAKQTVLDWDIFLNLREAEIRGGTVNPMNQNPPDLMLRGYLHNHL